MIRGRETGYRWWLAGGLLCLATTTAWASSGVVINQKGEPLAGVRVCYSLSGSDGLCASSNKKGEWELPRSGVDRIQLTLEGYLPKKISSGDQSAPVMLELAATLLVKLVDPSGDPIEEGEIELVYSSGRRIGPIPISRAAGTRIRSLKPGPVVVVGRSKGFGEGRAAESELRGGEEIVAIVPLEPAG